MWQPTTLPPCLQNKDKWGFIFRKFNGQWRELLGRDVLDEEIRGAIMKSSSLSRWKILLQDSRHFVLMIVTSRCLSLPFLCVDWYSGVNDPKCMYLNSVGVISCQEMSAVKGVRQCLRLYKNFFMHIFQWRWMMAFICHRQIKADSPTLNFIRTYKLV